MSSDCSLQAPPKDPADLFAELGLFAKETNSDFDVYGSGGRSLTEFESELASLLGCESAAFFMTGTLAQQVAFEVHCEKQTNKVVAVHKTAHPVHLTCLEDGGLQDKLFQEKAAQNLPGFTVLPVGSISRPASFDDLEAVCSDGATTVVCLELPMRMLGGATMSFDDLVRTSKLARSHGVKLHLDGARLWEVQPYYERSFSDICALFDSVYVSFYKGVGALGGAMLLGPRDFVDRSRVLRHRKGGAVFTLTPYALHSQMCLRAATPDDFAQRFKMCCITVAEVSAVATKLGQEHLIRFQPSKPQSAMVHCYLTGEREAIDSAHDKVISRLGTRLYNRLRGVGFGGHKEWYFEWTFGPSNSALDPSIAAAGFELLLQLLAGAE